MDHRGLPQEPPDFQYQYDSNLLKSTVQSLVHQAQTLYLGMWHLVLETVQTQHKNVCRFSKSH